MADENAKIDDNREHTLLGVTDDSAAEIKRLLVDATTGRLKVSATIATGAITSINADSTAAQTVTVGTTGTDFAIVDDASGDHAFNLPTASTTNRGALSSANWDTFNGKQAALTFGIANTNSVVINDAGVADDEYARFTASGLEGRTNANVAGDIGSSITTVGTIASGTWEGTTIAVDQGGTGDTSYTNGQLLIGNTSGNTLAKATLTGGTGVTVTDGAGSITIDADNNGTVTSVAAGNGLDFTSITATGSVTMGTPGTLTSATSDAVTATSHTHAITSGIADTNIVKVNDADAADDDYAKFTASGVEGRDFSEVRTDLGLVSGWFAAGETWTYASSDDPTYTFTIASFDATSKYSPGMMLKLTDSGTQYFFITKVVFDNPGSTITVYGGTDYDLSTGTITNPFYSVDKAPLNFPLDPLKWMVRVTDSTNRSQASPASGTWYNLGTTNAQIAVPIGAWRLSYSVLLYVNQDILNGAYSTLSTANNSESLTDMTSRIFIGGSTAAYGQRITLGKNILLATKATYYLNAKVTTGSTQTVYFLNADDGDMVLEAVCAYL